MIQPRSKGQSLTSKHTSMKTLMVTGATSGLGLEIVKVASKTCKVIACGRRAEILNRVQKRYKCGVIIGDINDWTWGEPPTINTIGNVTEYQNVDVFVHCAGEHSKKSTHKMTDSEIAGLLNTNLVSSILLLKRILSVMASRGKGTIVVINSLAGKYASPTEPVYSASKFGLRGFVEAIRNDYAKNNIRLISVYPGAMQTPMAHERDDFDKLLRPSDVAQFIISLCLKQKAMRLDDIEISRTTY